MLGVHNEDGLALEANPATVCERCKSLIHSFTGSTDELCDFFLSEVVVDAARASVLGAGAVSQLQEGLSNATGNVSEDEISQGSVGATQTTSQHAQELLSDRWVVSYPVAQHVGVHGCCMN